jgi:serine/threonine-protein kinase
MKEDKDLPEYIGRYRLRERIAKGGMSKIFRATDEIIGRDVAIKLTWTLDPAWKNLAPADIMNQFSLEAQISGQLSHHNFVTIYDAGMQGEFCYLVMELMEGDPLSAKIKAGLDSLEMRTKLETIVQVARALHYAHQRGIIHRDIKPSNIMLLDNEQAKVMDFGVAFLSEGSSIRLTKNSRQLPGLGGTPYYMSPEQINKKELDGRSDLFSLAVVAYELLTGRRPFSADNLFALYEKILRSEPEPIKSLNPHVPDKVAAIVSLCLNKDPNLRLTNCKALSDQIDEIINESFFEDSGAAITEETLATVRRYRESFQFFYDLDNQQVYRLLQVCRIKKFKKGDVIVTEGEVARDMYLVMNGQVKINRSSGRGTPFTLHMLKRGDIFGEMGIIDGGPRSASAVAETDCHCLSLHQVSLLRCDEATAGKIYRNLASILSHKLRLTSNKLDDLSRQTNL